MSYIVDEEAQDDNPVDVDENETVDTNSDEKEDENINDDI